MIFSKYQLSYKVIKLQLITPVTPPPPQLLKNIKIYKLIRYECVFITQTNLREICKNMDGMLYFKSTKSIFIWKLNDVFSLSQGLNAKSSLDIEANLYRGEIIRYLIMYSLF